MHEFLKGRLVALGLLDLPDPEAEVVALEVAAAVAAAAADVAVLKNMKSSIDELLNLFEVKSHFFLVGCVSVSLLFFPNPFCL